MTTQTLPRVRSAWALQDPLLTEYYDSEWGMPVRDEPGLFERLTLEAFQSGLSWLTVLKKREAFREAFSGFDPERVAAFDESDIQRLLSDASIIRNRAKIEATVQNAKAIVQLHRDGRTLAEVVWKYRPDCSPAPVVDTDLPSTSPESAALAKELKTLGFTFVGPTTMFALMCAVGIVDGHLVTSFRRGCSGLWNIDGSRV